MVHDKRETEIDNCVVVMTFCMPITCLQSSMNTNQQRQKHEKTNQDKTWFDDVS
jgi:hypothetical protein